MSADCSLSCVSTPLFPTAVFTRSALCSLFSSSLLSSSSSSSIPSSSESVKISGISSGVVLETFSKCLGLSGELTGLLLEFCRFNSCAAIMIDVDESTVTSGEAFVMF